MRCLFLLGLLALSSTAIQAQNKENVKTLSDFEYTKKIRDKIQKIAEIQPQNFRGEIDKYRDDVQTYFEHKKRVCRGEFSTVILGSAEGEEDNKDDKEKAGSKLSRKERKLCFREMKALQVTFINNMYKARRAYLEYLHDKRLNRLDEARNQTIKDLKESFSSP